MTAGGDGGRPVLSAGLGPFRLDVVRDGEFWLDGGAMFGVVPRVVWERLTPPDGSNRIRLQTNCLLIRDGHSTILVDTGIGDKVDEGFRARFRVGGGALIASLQALGVAPGDVDLVINTHLHWDHAGWNTRLDPRGNAVPTFQNARYVVQRAEWEEACAPTERSHASYRPQDFLPLEADDRLWLVDGEASPVQGVKVFRTPGHNRGMQGVLVEAREGAAAYLGDLVPTRHHLRLPFIMGYDLFPAETLETKRRLLPMAVEGRWLVVFDHDPDLPMAYLREGEKGRLEANPPRYVEEES